MTVEPLNTQVYQCDSDTLIANGASASSAVIDIAALIAVCKRTCCAL